MIKFKIKVFSLFILLTLIIIPQLSFAHHLDGQNADIMDGMTENQINITKSHEGPVFYNVMLHAWVSLLAAVAIFMLGLKYMVGGRLSRPIMLMGFGALTDAIIGIFFSSYSHLDYMWIGSLVFSLSVILGIIWMAQIFGVFQKQQ